MGMYHGDRRQEPAENYQVGLLARETRSAQRFADICNGQRVDGPGPDRFENKNNRHGERKWETPRDSAK